MMLPICAQHVQECMYVYVWQGLPACCEICGAPPFFFSCSFLHSNAPWNWGGGGNTINKNEKGGGEGGLLRARVKGLEGDRVAVGDAAEAWLACDV